MTPTLTILFCGIVPLLALVIFMGLVLFQVHRANKREKAQMLAQFESERQGWRNLIVGRDGDIQVRNERIALMETDARRASLERWFMEIQNISYSSELEVEIKFIYPLMRFLGFSPAALCTRIAVQVQVGRQKAQGIADWVVYNGAKALLVIEAKEPLRTLDASVEAQGRSYAYALGAPFYMLTNGREVLIYRRRVEDDLLSVKFSVPEIGAHWDEMAELLGKKGDT